MPSRPRPLRWPACSGIRVPLLRPLLLLAPAAVVSAHQGRLGGSVASGRARGALRAREPLEPLAAIVKGLGLHHAHVLPESTAEDELLHATGEPVFDLVGGNNVPFNAPPDTWPTAEEVPLGFAARVPVIRGLEGANLLNRTERDGSGVTLNGDRDTDILRSTLIFAGVGVLALVAVFSMLRRSNPAVYCRGSSIGAEEGGSYLGWITKVLATESQDEVEAAGLDGWSLLEFYRLNCRILMVMGPVIISVLCPVHFSATAHAVKTSNSTTMDLLSRFDCLNLPQGSSLWWLHALLVWLVVLVSIWCILRSHDDFLEKRFEWLKALPAPRATTIMVENIPHDYRSDEALKSYFSDLFPDTAVEAAYLVRKTATLRYHLVRLKDAKADLADARSTWDLAGRQPGQRAELVEKRAAQVKALEATVAAERDKVQVAGQKGGDCEVCSAVGFVTFSNHVWQRMAAREQYTRDTSEFVVSKPIAPDPDDVIWAELAQEHLHTVTHEWLGWLCLLMLFVFWTPMVVFISSWTTLSTIQEYVPVVNDWIAKFPSLSSLLEGVLATGFMKLALSFLPSVLLAIISRFFTIKNGAMVQFRLERWYFSFLVIFVLLVTALGRSLVITLAALVQRPTELLVLLSSSLPSASHFYFNYMVMGWFTLTWELIRIANLLKYWFFRAAHFSLDAAKRLSEPEDQASCGMGSRMATAALMSSITLVFCTASPLILPLAWLYFFIGRVTYGYLLVYTETKKPDLGGEFWFEALKQVFSMLVIYVLLMTGILLAHVGLRVGPPTTACLALVALYVGWRRVNCFAWETLPLEVLVRASREQENAPRVAAGRYVQEECFPMLQDESFPVRARDAADSGGVPDC